MNCINCKQELEPSSFSKKQIKRYNNGNNATCKECSERAENMREHVWVTVMYDDCGVPGCGTGFFCEEFELPRQNSQYKKFLKEIEDLRREDIDRQRDWRMIDNKKVWQTPSAALFPNMLVEEERSIIKP